MNITFKKVKDGRLVFPSVTRDQMKKDEIYNFDGLITEAMHRGRRELRFYEYRDPGTASLIMTSAKGEKPLASMTNDCARDNFPPKCLATVIVDVGNYVLYAYPKLEQGIDTGMQHLIIFRVEELSPNVAYAVNAEKSINLKLIDRYVTSTHHGIKFNKEAVRHVLLSNRRIGTDYCSPKYCFSPGRVVDTRLFAPEEGGRLVSYGPDGTKLVINEKSELYNEYKAGYVYGTPIFIRCFYSKKLIGMEKIYVDGAIVDMVNGPDIDDYVRASVLTVEKASNIIKRAYMANGASFYATVNLRGEVRPIYRNSYGFMTMLLTETEMELIERMDDLAI